MPKEDWDTFVDFAEEKTAWRVEGLSEGVRGKAATGPGFILLTKNWDNS